MTVCSRPDTCKSDSSSPYVLRVTPNGSPTSQTGNPAAVTVNPEQQQPQHLNPQSQQQQQHPVEGWKTSPSGTDNLGSMRPKAVSTTSLQLSSITASSIEGLDGIHDGPTNKKTAVICGRRERERERERERDRERHRERQRETERDIERH